MKLYSTRDGHEVKPGDEVTTSRGEKAVLQSLDPPRNPPSTGHVTIKFYDTVEGYYYPSVIGCQFIDELHVEEVLQQTKKESK